MQVCVSCTSQFAKFICHKVCYQHVANVARRAASPFPFSATPPMPRVLSEGEQEEEE